MERSRTERLELPTGRTGRWLRAGVVLWLSVELFSGILALCLLVALLPTVEVLLWLRGAMHGWAVFGALLDGGATAYLLGRPALRMPLDLFRGAARGLAR